MYNRYELEGKIETYILRSSNVVLRNGNNVGLMKISLSLSLNFKIESFLEIQTLFNSWGSFEP